MCPSSVAWVGETLLAYYSVMTKVVQRKGEAVVSISESVRSWSWSWSVSDPGRLVHFHSSHELTAQHLAVTPWRQSCWVWPRWDLREYLSCDYYLCRTEIQPQIKNPCSFLLTTIYACQIQSNTLEPSRPDYASNRPSH
jgi:hypothetical protein